MINIKEFKLLNPREIDMQIQLKDGYRLNTLKLEELISEKNNLDKLPEINFQKIDTKYIRKKLVKFYLDEENNPEKKIEKLYINSPVKKPHSMIINSIEELKDNMLFTYQISYYHYILGKKFNMKNTFPRMCCGMSSRNILFSLVKQGYSNAIYGLNKTSDHSYTLIPFVFKKENIKGSIIVDPTYDQLWNKTNRRNEVFLKLGSEWEYITEWNRGNNLFPELILSINEFKEIASDRDNDHKYNHNVKDYFKQAFDNPVNIQIKGIKQNKLVSNY